MTKISKSSTKKTKVKAKKVATTIKKPSKAIKKIATSAQKTKVPIKISKNYTPKETEKYMCDKHLSFFKIKLTEWKKELVKANNEALTMDQWMTIVFQQISLTKQALTQIKQ